MRPYSFSNPFKEHCKNLIRGLDVEVTSQALKICAGNVGHRWVQVRKVVKRNMHCCEQRVLLVPIRNVENQVLPDRDYC